MKMGETGKPEAKIKNIPDSPNENQNYMKQESTRNKYCEQAYPLMPLGKAMKTIITKYYFNQRYPIIFFCNDKDIINQLSEEQLKTIKLRECNTVNKH